GVVANSVVRRRRELAIRLALGATHRQAVYLIVRSAALSTLAGLALGSLAIAALARVLNAFLFGVTALTPAIYLFTLAGTATLALLACVVPTRSIFRLTPKEILRE